jgi:hypothetical protein
MDNFAQTIGNLTLAHGKVKAIKPKSLPKDKLRQRSQQLTELRSAIDQLVTVQFGALAASAQASAVQLEGAAGKLSKALEGIKTAIGVLDAVGAALGTITSLVNFVKGVPS